MHLTTIWFYMPPQDPETILGGRLSKAFRNDELVIALYRIIV
ncbi:MAG: hypothetical protein ACK4OM_02940 [Alphaproteobacteria bacterium]